VLDFPLLKNQYELKRLQEFQQEYSGNSTNPNGRRAFIVKSAHTLRKKPVALSVFVGVYPKTVLSSHVLVWGVSEHEGVDNARSMGVFVRVYGYLRRIGHGGSVRKVLSKRGLGEIECARKYGSSHIC
jgi:hypothetical protein